MNKKLPIIFMVIILFLNLFTGFIGFATGGYGSQEDYIEDFEDDTISYQAHDDYFGDEWFYTSQNSTDTTVDDTHTYSGTKAYRQKSVYTNNNVLFTINVSSVYNISFYTKRTNAYTGSGIHFQFNNATNHTIIEIQRTNDGSGKTYCEYQEYDDDWNRIGTDVENTEWVDFSFEITSIDTVVYHWMGDTETGTPNTITTDISYSAIKYVWWWTEDQGAPARYLYMDNFTIVQGYTTPPEDEGTLPPCTPYSTIGNIGMGNIAYATSYHYLWTVYGVETRMNVVRLDLEIGDEMANNYETSDIEAKLGIYNLGTANSIVELSSGHYRVSWTGLNAYINNTVCPIMFKFSVNYGVTAGYGFPIRGLIFRTDDDLNNDGLNLCVFTNAHDYYINFANYIDHSPIDVGSSYFVAQYEPVVRMCADLLGTSELKDHIGNDIWCSPTELKTGEFTEIGYSLNLSLMGESNKFIVIQKPDTTNESIWSITTQTGGTTYTPNQQGLHYANLSIDGNNVSSTSFTVSGSLDDWLYTYQNPSEPNENFNIIYNYTKSGTGAIRIFDSNNNLVQTFYVNPESSGNETTNLPSGKYYIKLQEIITVGSVNQYVTLFTYPHSVQGQVVDYIEVEQEVTSVDYGFRIYGQHNHVGKNIVIRVGGSEEIDVSSNQDFSEWSYPTRSDYYRVSLILKKPDGSELELDWDYVTVKSSIFDDDTKTGVENIMDMIPDFYKVIGGIILTILITLSPFIFMIKASKYIGKPININIPPITYPLLFTGGTVLSLVIGLYGIEIFFLFVAGGFISIVFVYISGMKSGSGDNGNE